MTRGRRPWAEYTPSGATARAPARASFLQRKSAGGQQGVLQRRAECRAEAHDVPPIVDETLRSPGRPLDDATRDFMESRFGHDFSGVRVHTDARAAESARAVNALAYTVGRDVVFREGQFAPATRTGQRLLAHELAHVVQQQPGVVSRNSLSLGQVNDVAEQEADRAMESVGHGVSAPVSARVSGPRLQRQAAPGTAYNLRLTYPPNHSERHNGLTMDAALSVLRMFAGRIEGHLEGGLAGHRSLIENHDNHAIIAAFSDFFGGVSLPSLNIWNGPRELLRQGREDIARADIGAATRRLQRAAQEMRAAENQVYEYREGTITGGERAVFGLEVVEVASAVVVTVGTGGAAGVMVGAGYAGVQRLAGEAAGVSLGLQDHIDWGGVVFDTLFAAVAGRFGGQLGRSIAARLGGRVAAQVVSQLIVGRGAGLAHAVAREVFDGVRGQTQLTVEGFINRLAEQLTLRAAFMDLVAAAVGAGTVSARARTGSAPAPAESRPSTPEGSRPPRVRLVSPTESPAPRSAPARASAPASGEGVIDLGAARSARAATTAPPAATSSSGGARAFDRGTALRLAPQEAVSAGAQEPRLRVITAPEVEPQPTRLAPPTSQVAPTTAASTPPGSTSASAVPGAVAVTASAGTTVGPSTPPLQIRLILPPEKAVHADLYRGLVRERRLEHVPGKPRQTAQAANWDRELRPGGPMGIYEEIWQNFNSLGVEEKRRLRPNWTRTSSRIDMQVDHRVEWQLLGAGNEEWADSMANYELLDQPSNGSAGSTLRANIQAERARLATQTGNPLMLTQRIVFTQLIAPSPSSAAMRWLPEEIQRGEHYHALVRLLGSERD